MQNYYRYPDNLSKASKNFQYKVSEFASWDAKLIRLAASRPSLHSELNALTIEFRTGGLEKFIISRFEYVNLIWLFLFLSVIVAKENSMYTHTTFIQMLDSLNCIGIFVFVWDCLTKIMDFDSAHRIHRNKRDVILFLLERRIVL